MLINELKDIAREYGVVGAGGAGFPSYAKMTEKADTVILNCVECEPLLKLHRQLLAMQGDLRREGSGRRGEGYPCAYHPDNH